MKAEKSQYELLEEILESFMQLRQGSNQARVNSFGMERSSNTGREENWDRIDQRIKSYIAGKYPHTTRGNSPISKASSIASQLTRKSMKTSQGGESLRSFKEEMGEFREKTGEEALSRVLEVGVNYLVGETKRETVEKLSRQIQKAAD